MNEKTCALAGWNLRDGINLVEVGMHNYTKLNLKKGTLEAELAEDLENAVNMSITFGTAMIRHEVEELKSKCNMNIDTLKIKNKVEKINQHIKNTELEEAKDELISIRDEIAFALRGFHGL